MTDVASPKGPDAEAVTASGPSLFDLLSGIVAGYVRDGEAEVNRARGASGALEVVVKVSLEEGRVVWSRGSVAFERTRLYRESR